MSAAQQLMAVLGSSYGWNVESAQTVDSSDTFFTDGVCALTDTKAVVLYHSASRFYAKVLDVLGGTVTAGAALDIAAYNSQATPSIHRLTDTTALIFYASSAAVLSVSGSTLTLNTPLGITYLEVGCVVTPTRAFYGTYRSDTFVSTLGTLAVSGVTLTTEALLNPASGGLYPMYRLDDTRVLTSQLISGAFTVRVSALSGVDIVQGDELTIDSSTVTGNALTGLSDSTAIVTYEKSSQIKAYVLSVSGTTVTKGFATTLDASATANSGGFISLSSSLAMSAYKDGTVWEFLPVSVSGTTATGGTIAASTISDTATLVRMAKLGANVIVAYVDSGTVKASVLHG